MVVVVKILLVVQVVSNCCLEWGCELALISKTVRAIPGRQRALLLSPPFQMPCYLNHHLCGICSWSAARADRRGVFTSFGVKVNVTHAPVFKDVFGVFFFFFASLL